MAPHRVSDSPPAPIGDVDAAVRLLSDVTDESVDEVRARLDREQRHLGLSVREEAQTWNITPHEWNDRLVEFYRKSNAFLFESFVYNSTTTKHSLRRWILQFLQRDQPGSCRVLMFGDGLGFDTAFLAQHGYETAYFEVGQPCVQFAERVFELNHVTVEVHEQQETVPKCHYDVVICLDVLEHVPAPPALVCQLAGYLRPGGRLIVHAPFWYIHPDVVTHLRSNVRYSGDWRTLYEPAGLRPFDAGMLWCPIVLAKDPLAKPASFGARCRIVASGCLLRLSRISTIPLVAFSKCFFAPKPDRR